MAAGERIKIQYTVENQITGDERMFQATLHLETQKRPFYEIMLEAAGLDPRFQFKSKTFEGLGVYITEVNGLHEDEEKKLFWAVLKRQGTDADHSDCYSTLGVSNFEPRDGEHVVLSYAHYDISEKIPACPEVK